MRAEVISIGDELTTGQRLDTNSQWLSRELGDLGIRVLFHTTVGDELDANVEVFRRAIERAEIVIATGGLGPTADDLTRDALAAVAGKTLVLHQPSLEHIQRLFAQRTRSMPERNRVQAMFPEGAIPIHNPHGTAPGIEMSFDFPGRQSHLFALPGVPGEMKELWSESVAPRIRQLLGAPRIIRHHVIKCFGVGESDLEQRLPDLIRRGRTPTVGITVSHATISLRITAEGSNADDCQAQIEPTRQIIYDCLGDLIFGEGDGDELQHAVLRTLQSLGKTLSLCEWGTKGLATHWLTDAPPPPGTFVGSWQIADRSALKNFPLAADVTSLTNGELVRELASACRQWWGTDYALVIGPWPESDSSDSNAELHFGIATDERVLVRQVSIAGHPEILFTRAAKQALNWLRLRLLGRTSA